MTRKGIGASTDEIAKRLVDIALSTMLLITLSLLLVVLALAVKLESRGPVLYRAERVGRHRREFPMLKFRKMAGGATGAALTAVDDPRFTRIGGFLADTKLDELPQLWNVLRGQMSFVGPRPEHPDFVEHERDAYEQILSVRPGITGLSQLAFARESAILDPNDRIGHYERAILPQKLALDGMYAERRSLRFDLRIMWWTAIAVVLRRSVAVDRRTAHLNVRRRPQIHAATATVGRRAT